jgi:hypothetical protein
MVRHSCVFSGSRHVSPMTMAQNRKSACHMNRDHQSQTIGTADKPATLPTCSMITASSATR